MPVPVDAHDGYRVVYRLAKLLTPMMFDLQAENRELVPLQQGGVLVSNHPGGFDFLVLGLACPRQIHYMGKVELFQINPLVTAFFRSVGVFPVRRGQRDTGAIEAAIDIVRSGKLLGMFPEGTRNRREHMTRGKSGAARIALAIGAPVIPVGVVGAAPAARHWYRQLGRPRIKVRFGEPYILDGDPGDLSFIQHATTEIMVSIARLLPVESRGVYADLVAG